MTDVVIAGAARTPVGAFTGGLSSMSASQLDSIAIQAALKRSGVAETEISEVILGQVLTAGCCQNPARQAAIAAGIPNESTAVTINQVCGSGIRSVAMGYQAIKAGDSTIVVAGGQENMSLSPHCQHLRNGVKMGDYQMIDTIIQFFKRKFMSNTGLTLAVSV
ncbi:MAG: hypothetical protein GY742_03310 [Hyphomicrobiales bacterium]|nr:hypothetical protein [Hyphomicrobiales bacterium]